ncbi:hypothetical protein M413DRAFT_441232 [Hebeloma cylindrosporum]|uniref:Uncharacterized protein n=1 Tax=Hebeloma cylindrosporum TaxID=76867 RepID=A0A0C3CQ08_HEBCY|nr:hypothetical protein M413DRAFT_441232 [Hebeloma cylindrosporum h7]
MDYIHGVSLPQRDSLLHPCLGYPTPMAEAAGTRCSPSSLYASETVSRIRVLAFCAMGSCS